MDEGFLLEDSTIAILGLGLMGGSLALALGGHCRAVWGSDPDPATLEAACRRRIVDRAVADPAEVAAAANVIVLAAPVPAILELLERLPSLTDNPCIVIDIGSTKQAIVGSMGRLPARFDPIGGHPLCGKEDLSLANAERELYRNATFFLTPLDRTTARAVSAASQIVDAIGAKPVMVDAAKHDHMLAATSHLPFLVSSALALAAPDDCAGFAGPGFRSASRLAGTSSSMMLGVLQSNRENVLQALHLLRAELTGIERALAEQDFPFLEKILDEARNKYRKLVQ
ncbi:MAG TPA: prephenate dehydrogenase [Anaerolineales bacterium]